MIKFVSADATSFERKRKQNQSLRACDNCRKRKKRCMHATTSEGLRLPEQLSIDSDSPFDICSPAPPAHNDTRTASSTQRPRRGVLESQDRDLNPLEHRRDSEILGSRFIGDLNPESVLLAATSPDATRDASSNESIGVWLAERLQKRGLPANSHQAPAPSLFHGFTSTVQQILVPILQEESLSLLPPPSNREALTALYFEKVHPIFPVISQARFKDLQPSSSGHVLLQQGICLVASMNFSVTQHLRLVDPEILLSHREFGKRLIAAMKTSIEIGLVTDKMVLIQALSLMSFFTEEPDGKDASSLMCGRAVHGVHSLGLHIQRNQSNSANDYNVTLLCCVWGLDRLNAAFNGRPVFMHERDLGRDLDKCIDMQEPCFRLLLRVIMLLDKVIDLYRPGRGAEKSDWQGDFMLFDELLTNCRALHVPTPFLATIETLYHAVAILSCRTSPSETLQSSSASHTRQSLSAGRVTSMAGHEFREQLILFPFVPYAVSLSLSIAYREMRRSKVPMYRARARCAFQSNCRILEDLGRVFWSASVMADMGKLTLKELDRVYSTVAQSQHQRSHEDTEQTRSNPSVHQFSSTAHQYENAQDNETNSTEAADNLDSTFPPPQDVNLAFLDDMPGLDAFEMFDPSFDLDGMDAFLESNLDLSFPTNFY